MNNEPLLPPTPPTPGFTPQPPLQYGPPPQQLGNMPVGPGMPQQLPKKRLSKTSKRIFIGLGVGTFLFAVLGVVVFGFVLPNTPEVILKNALENTLSVSSMKVSGSSSIETGSGITLNSDLVLRGNTQGDSEFMFAVKVGPFDVVIDTKTVDESGYIKISGIKNVGGLVSLANLDKDQDEQLADIVAAIDNQWLEVDPNLLSLFGLNNASRLSLSPEDIAAITSAARSNQFLKVNEKLPDEDIEGVPNYHMTLSFDKDAFISFLSSISTIKIAGISISDKAFESYLNSLTSNLEVLENSKIDVWVDKHTRRFTKTSVSINTNGGMTTKFDVAFSDFNSTEEIVAPDDAKSLFNIFNDFYDKYVGRGFFKSGASAIRSFQIGRRDDERKSEADIIEGAVLNFNTTNDRFPTVAEFTDVEWRAINLPTLTEDTMTGPNDEVYPYSVTDDDGKSCEKLPEECTKFKLSADLEEDGFGVNDKDRDTEDYVVGEF